MDENNYSVDKQKDSLANVDIVLNAPTDKVGTSTKDNIGNKKNRTLQFYSWMFYAIKLEIVIYDFINQLRTNCILEVLLWLLSLVLNFNWPDSSGATSSWNGYISALLWYHIWHVARGVIGIVFYCKLPRTFDYVQSLNNVEEKVLSKEWFNDILRNKFNTDVLNKFKEGRVFIIIYFSLTAINVFIDSFDFFICLFRLHWVVNAEKAALVTYIIILVMYFYCDSILVKNWMGLKYVFPKKYTDIIDNAVIGKIKYVKTMLKLGKPKTDIKNENNNVQNKLPELSEKVVHL